MEDWLDPCLDAEEMRATDAWAIKERGVPSLELMETAGRAVAEAAAQVATSGSAAIVCGKGNNSGDGRVAARALRQTGFEVDALLLAPPDELSDDAKSNLDRFDGARHLEPGELAEAVRGVGVVIDAVFGTGFAGAPRGPGVAAIEAINEAEAPVVATDIASGVNASTGEVEGKVVEADLTVTFHAPKLGHWIAPGKEHTGDLRWRRRVPPDRPSSARARCSSSVDHVASRARSAWRRWRRSGQGRDTRRWLSPPTWSTSSRSS